VKTHILINWRPIINQNVMQCSCGVLILSDCDMSRTSTNQAFEQHLREEGVVVE
jgi:hypothetical protein